MDEDELEVKVPRWRAGSEIAGCWDYLRANRKRFLTKELVKQYLGFARGQIKQVETKPETNRKKVSPSLVPPQGEIFTIFDIDLQCPSAPFGSQEGCSWWGASCLGRWRREVF